MSAQPAIRFSTTDSYVPKYLSIYRVEPTAHPPSTPEPMNRPTNPPMYPQATPLTIEPPLLLEPLMEETPTQVPLLVLQRLASVIKEVPTLPLRRIDMFI